ncbi:MAG: DoxX family protein [Deltaproteobacteria bacterium]|jgi:thiosulfate dehydrogenase (quinone) large subunit|nr:DoxX family protein [Deltaproteobacteria bacterium]
MNLKGKTYLFYIVILRLWIGYYFLQQGTRKFLHGFANSDWIGRQIGDLATIDIYSWYRSFLITIVNPHHVLFGYLITWGEIMVGLCLLLGIFTRFSSFIGLFIVLNFFFGPGMAKGGASFAQQQTFLVTLVVFILSNPGQTFGLDRFLFKRR